MEKPFSFPCGPIHVASSNCRRESSKMESLAHENRPVKTIANWHGVRFAAKIPFTDPLPN